MDQRPLRLGDILDDYCPRERRVTNHAVVAMIDDAVKQTRCTTCDTEHVYKGARVPRRRTKDNTPATLYKEVLAGMPEPEATPALAVAVPGNIVDVPDLPVAPIAEAIAAADQDHDAESAEPETEPSAREDGPVHRQLLRAKLPRVEGQKDARPIPEFTIRQAAARSNGHFRGDRSKARGGSDPRAMMGRGGANGNSANGNRGHGGGARFQGGRPGGGGQHRNAGGRGPQNPFRGGSQRHGGKKGRG